MSLFNVDLLRQLDRWKGGLDEMRTMAATLSEQRYTAASMQPWLVHWDHQVRKALEHQYVAACASHRVWVAVAHRAGLFLRSRYQMGLESLNENMPEIKVELAFRQRRLQFKPPLEDIRVKYDRPPAFFVF